MMRARGTKDVVAAAVAAWIGLADPGMSHRDELGGSREAQAISSLNSQSAKSQETASDQTPTSDGRSDAQSPTSTDDAFIRLMNVAKAHLENRESAKAIEALEAAVKLRPDSPAAWRNLGRAQLLARDHEGALATLAKARPLEPNAVATAYLTGLSYVRLSRFEEAIAPLEETVRSDPNTATLRFQLANAYQAVGKDDKAVEQLKETVRLDPFHTSAHYKLGTYARKAGDKEEFQRRHQEFMRLRKIFGDESRSAEVLEQCIYTDPEPAVVGAAPPSARAKPIDVRFVDATEVAFGSPLPDGRGTEAPTDGRGIEDNLVAAAAVVEVDEDGRCTLLASGEDGTSSLWGVSPEGRWRRAGVTAKLPDGFKPKSCIVGDFHDDVPTGEKYDPAVHMKNDILVVGEKNIVLLKRTGLTSFQDVTEAAGLAGLSADRACWVDYEHDGDLDLLLARQDGLQLWQNNGNGTFEDVTALVGIPNTSRATDVTVVDLEADVAIDVLVARGDEPTLVMKNRRAGQFALMPEPPGPWPAARRVVAEDLDNDGRADAVLVDDAAATIIYGQSMRRDRIDLSAIRAPVVALVDYDNDGWPDVVAYGSAPDDATRGAVRVFRSDGEIWKDVTTTLGVDGMTLPPVTDVIPADMDADGDTDLVLVTTSGRPRYWRNEGGHANGQLKIRLVPLKTNPSGVGTEIEVRDGTFRATRTIRGLPIKIGLGGHKRADAVRVVWTNGVVDNQVDVEFGDRPMTIEEKNVATGSCPFLYAWDGERHRFVTDILGNAPIGLSVARGVMLDADWDEIVTIGGAEAFRPRDGRFILTVTEEFREALYLDDARLMAVDHDPAVEVHPTDKLMPAPFPPSEVWALGSPMPLRSAVGDDAIDRTAAMRDIDGVFAPPGVNLPAPLRGKCYPLAITLDFGPLEASRPYVLALTGWLQYGDASRNIALSQNPDAVVIPPKVEVESAGGAWLPMHIEVGMPAGKTKTILCDLNGKLPDGAKRLRLATTFELRWDRAALFERLDLPGEQVHVIGPAGADLHYRGFSEIKSRRPGHPTTPDFDVVSEFPPWRTTLEGWCTRYGDVLELVTNRDERLVIVNAGDALTLGFAADALPPTPPAMTRTFFFYSVGLEKDADHNVVDGSTIEPLPAPLSSESPASMDDETYTDWRIEYNTRWTPGDQFADR